ncbi:hypothetical protein [Burkholderia sp. LMG 21824]|uniref:hypothetical protein n=1 Tax=Burkholderia sp. LMG 21824 TaxID=3158172 RepID=UPI003C2EEC9F
MESNKPSLPTAADPHAEIPADLLPGYLFVDSELRQMADSMRVSRSVESEPAQVFNLQTLLR